MRTLFGQCRDGIILIHGGAGMQDPTRDNMREATLALEAIVMEAYVKLGRGESGLDLVEHCLKAMEANELFNAGLGSALQEDAQARMTAAMMSGTEQKFSGVISVSYLKHPSLLARYLQNSDSRVLTNPGAELLARKLGHPVEYTVTKQRMEKWLARKQERELLCDTVGCVVRLPNGELFAGTSTGGRGFEFPGRVSDSATVAGNYASKFAAISATGVGEELVDDALAARVETRVRDGMTLKDACSKSFSEAQQHSRSYGWIALSENGDWSVLHTTPYMAFALASKEGVVTSSIRD